jgi:gamma-glutamyltranspeptidase/glutathione hydrolase
MRLARTLTVTAAIAVSILPLAAPAAGFYRDGPRGTGGAIASGDARATAVGLDVLRAGGNAADAAVATALALAVVYPEAGNLGGGGFAVARPGGGRAGEVAALDFREVAPAAARRGMFVDAQGEPIRDASSVGPLAAGVPGSPAGLWELHRKLGRLPWARLVEPARRLAADGFVVGSHLHDLLEQPKTRALLSRFPESARVWLPGGRPPPAGSRLRLPELAATLAAYEARGPAALSRGPAAAAVETASRRHGGVLVAADLAAYRPVWRTPLAIEAFGWRIAAMPLPSSGGILVGQTLGVLERLGWAKRPRYGADRAHLLAEAFRGAYADRFLLGDPSTTRATAADLLSPRWIARRAAGIDPAHVRRSSAVTPWTAGAGREGSETTQISVIDADGGMVSLTTTLNELFGCGLYVPEAGFFLNDEMDDFAAAPGRPNLFRLVQGEANAVAPGKRMLSSMVPLVAWRGGEELALGGRGGSRIPTHVAQVLLDLMVDGDTLAAALGRPRIHHQWLPDRIEAEEGALSPETWAELERRGHQVVANEKDDVAKVQAVRRLADGRLEAASDPRDTDGAGVVAPEPP